MTVSCVFISLFFAVSLVKRDRGTLWKEHTVLALILIGCSRLDSSFDVPNSPDKHHDVLHKYQNIKAGPPLI